MQKESFFLSNNGVGVSFCIENGIISQINLSNCDKTCFPEKSPFDKFFEKTFLYLSGKSVDFTEDLRLLNMEKFTFFQSQVYNILIKIKFGDFISYEKLAEKLGNKNLRRAVGRVLGLNPYPLVIPCHRVLPKNFSIKNIGGFSEGIDIKRRLLKIEKII
ncbi:MAG: methylated-DNA--[protein]-cysteine S-methyltransferase [Brevinematales bacterium]